MREPNLTDYETVYQDFDWEQAEQELGFGLRLNIAQAAVDAQCSRGLKDKVALRFWEGMQERQYTFGELKELSDRFALVLRRHGVRPGDRVVLFGPALPEFYVSFLGIVKSGAVAVPVFEGYMTEALMEILEDSDAVALVTTPALEQRIDRLRLPRLKLTFLVGIAETGVESEEKSWYRAVDQATGDFEAALLDRDAPFALLYTSGSTGKPKGVVLSHGGLVQYYWTGLWVLDLKPDDVYWCTADLGWVTGVGYGILAPWLNGVTTVVCGGSFSPQRWFQFIERFGVTVWYTTPTALRLLLVSGNAVVGNFTHRLRHIVSVGEPLNPAIIRWARAVFGLDVYDTWFMTETGAHIIANFRCLPVKPGSMGKPVPGIQVAVVDAGGREVGPLQMGQLAIRVPWPAMMRGIWRDPEKYAEYFRLPPWYLSGDLVYRDRDGYYWYQGRIDDIIKVGERRVGPFEVESKLMEHPAVLEAGVIGKPNLLLGETVKAFLVLRPGHQWSPKLRAELQRFVKNSLAEHMVPQEFEVCMSLPRTRTGKLLRRVLKAWEVGLPESEVAE
ncbi:MAG: AMP-binding protein [Thermoanaerobacteraceae bacterium]|jgi:acetyl-CoA synthetase|nr:AMP-binding protein [Thermoanaerobacteraceae bacterium]